MRLQEEGYEDLGESIAMNEEDVEDNLPVAFEALSANLSNLTLRYVKVLHSLIYQPTHLSFYLYLSIYLHIYMYIYIYMYVYIYIYIYSCIYTYIYIYSCIYTYIFIYIYIYT